MGVEPGVGWHRCTAMLQVRETSGFAQTTLSGTCMTVGVPPPGTVILSLRGLCGEL